MTRSFCLVESRYESSWTSQIQGRRGIFDGQASERRLLYTASQKMRYKSQRESRCGVLAFSQDLCMEGRGIQEKANNQKVRRKRKRPIFNTHEVARGDSPPFKKGVATRTQQGTAGRVVATPQCCNFDGSFGGPVVGQGYLSGPVNTTQPCRSCGWAFVLLASSTCRGRRGNLKDKAVSAALQVDLRGW